MKLAVFLAVALLAASASASFTGHWHSKPFTTAPSPKTAAGYKAAFEALPDLGVSGYCSTPITNFAQFSNPILCPGNANSDYAAQLTVSFTTEVAEQFCFRYGVDSTYGGVISIDGNVLYQQYTDMWWAGNWNSNGVFEGCMHLAAGAHTFTGYVFESCCGGSSRLEVKIGTGEYMPVSGSLDLPETEAPVGFEDNTPTVGEVEEGFASIIVDTNAAGKVFCAAVPAGSAVPTHNQISMPEWWGAIGQTSAETDGSSAVLILFGLQAGTDYDLYCTTESENQHAPLSEEGILATKRSFSTKLCPESTLTSHSAAYYHSRHLPTGTPVPTDGLGKKALFDSLVDGVTGYCKFDFTAPLAGITNARACGSNSDIAFKVSYTLQITTAGDYDFVVGPDFGLGSTVIADGVAVANTNDDLWWQNDVNNADTLRFTINFAVGEHTLEIYGFEQCCDGGLSLFGAHSGETLTILGSNDEFPIEIPLMFEDIHIGTIAENTVMIKADLNREASIYCSAFYANDDFVPTFSDLLLGTAFSRHTVSASAPFCDENSSVCLAVTGLRECVTYDIYCAARDVNGYFTEVTSAGRHRVKTECHVEDFIAECDSCKSGLVTVGTDEYHSVSLSFNNDGTYNTDCT